MAAPTSRHPEGPMRSLPYFFFFFFLGGGKEKGEGGGGKLNLTSLT